MGRPGCRPLQEIFIFPVGANCVRPFFHTIIVPFRATIGRPYKGFLLYSVGAIHESPAFVHDMRSLSAGRRGSRFDSVTLTF